MRKQSHSPDRAVIPSRSHPSVIGAEHGSTLIFLRNEGSRERCVIISGIALAFALDFQLSTVNLFLTGSLEGRIIISGIAPPFAFDFQLSTVNLFPTGSLEGRVIISGIALAFALDFQLSTVNFFLKHYNPHFRKTHP
jgi:hypothetical protein